MGTCPGAGAVVYSPSRGTMAPGTNHPPLLAVLRLGSFLCFAGWTWAHFYWQGPYGILLWRESTYALAERWGTSWDEFVGTGANDGVVQRWIGGIAWLYLGCCVLSLAARRKSRWQTAGLIGGAGLLAILSYAKYLGEQCQAPTFVEHGGQILMPALLASALSFGERHRATEVLAMVAIVATFAGHGAYALGMHWPTPANFLGMTRVILGVDGETARALLRVAGALDFAVCLGILLPVLRRPCALYAAAWGFLTSLARPWAGMSTELNYWGADQFLHEMALRAPHFLIPLYLFLLWRRPPAEKAAEAAAPSEWVPDPKNPSLP